MLHMTKLTVSAKDLDALVKAAVPQLRKAADCFRRNHRDAEGRPYPQQMVLDRGGSGNDLYYCTNCEMPHPEKPPYAKVQKFYNRLKERVTI